VLGAISTATDAVRVGVGVTCPTVRMHPAIVAHASATTALMFDGRFFLGVGSGEALNEHILGHRWPPADVRRMMLEEAIDIIRALWSGDTVDHRGDFYTVENARLFDPPEQDPPIIVSGFGSTTVELAASVGDGYWGHAPDGDAIDLYRRKGGSGPRYSQLNVCYADSAAEARKTAHQVWPNGGMTGQLSQDLPTWTHFEQAAAMVSEQEATKDIPCGPEVEPIVESVQRYIDAGYDHLYFHQIGPDQDGFLRFWRDALHPALRDLEPT
jgi:G6PDH family F420-dependent oxidoreductase